MKTYIPAGSLTTQTCVSSTLRTLLFASILIVGGSVALGQGNYNHPGDCWLLNNSNYGVPYTGSNPSLPELKTQMQSLATTYHVPIEVIAAICYRESGMYQYGGDSFLVHNKTECSYAFLHGVINSNGAPPPPGLGLMQLTSSTATQFNPGQLITDWRYNLEAGVQILVQKYNLAIAGDPQCLINLRNQAVAKTILENWYYAIRYYYGANSPDSEYLDIIYGYISNPPARLVGFFPAVTITKPQVVIPGFTTTQGFCAETNGVWTNYQCNTYSGTVHVSSSFGGGGADLALQSISATHGTYHPGDSLFIPSLSVANVGGATSANYTISYYLSTDTTITPSDIFLETSQSFPGLAAGASQGFQATVTIPTPITAANYYVGAIVNVTPDANPSNNANYDPTPITVSSTQTRIIDLSGNLAFGDVQVGSSSQRTLTISNSGNSTLTVNSISYPSGFSGSFSGTIGAGSSHDVTVTFAPGSVGSYGGTVTVNSDATSGTNTIGASGTGTNTVTRIISLSGNLAFGDVTVGTSAQRTLTISNSGTSTLTVSSISYPSGFSGSFSGPIGAGSSHDVTVTFAPGAVGSYGGTVTVNSDATSGTNTIGASGTGTNTVTRIIGLSGNLAFGNVTVGSSAQRTLTISNSGTSTLTVSGISYPNGFSGSFSGAIGAGNSQNVTVTFAPGSVASYGGTVTVNSDATSGNNTIAASGNGTMNATPTPNPSCPPTITQSSTQTITLQNSVSCNNGTGHTDNSYWRAFDMTSFVGSNTYNVTSVSFGIEQATAAGGIQPVTVRLHTSSQNFPTGFPGSLTQIATATFNVPDSASNTVFLVPITATVPAGAQLVMEVFTPDGTAAGNLLFIGSNADFESGQSYLSAASCGFTTPTTTAAVGFPNMHLVFNVNGNCGPPPPSPTPTATATATPPPCGTTVTFSNPAPITINDALPASPYPSNITVAGVTNPVTKVTVTITGFNHTFPSDVDMLLVGPGGQKFVLVSDVIGGTDAVGINWTLDDAAAAFIGSTGTPASGTFKPTNYTDCQDPFTAPAPSGPYLSPGGIGTPCGTDTLGAFNGVNPNGTWRLYVVDDLGADVGNISGGWSLNITTAGDGCASTILANISTRLRVETGNNVLIGGFIVTGTQPKKVIVRAIGPSLASLFTGVLADPVLELHGPAGFATITNDNWRSNQQAEILATGIPPTNDLESAIVATLPANNTGYSAIVRGVNNGTGIGVVEAYDLDRTVDSKLANISTRGLVQTGNNVMIGGLIVLGQNPLRVIVRAIGPSLPVPGALSDPTLELRDGNGALIAANDDWRSDQEAEIIATTIPPSNDLESAIVRNLTPGNYTAIVRGVNSTTGVALVEAYGLN